MSTFTPSRASTLSKEAADVLAGRICHAASLAAQSEYQLISLVGEFDATEAIRWWVDLKSVAHWLAWTCSMTPGTAREHVRVAKALRQMPTVAAAFAEGRLSYSKVREVTRVVGVVDEVKLCELALTATASQLARMIRGYRLADGLRLPAEAKRHTTWHHREDGMTNLRALLPGDEAAVVVAALNAARDRNEAAAEAAKTGTAKTDTAVEPAGDPDSTDAAKATEAEQPSSRFTNADALVELARAYLAAVSEDRSGEDRTLVVVHVAADTLAGEPHAGERGDVPAGTSEASSPVEQTDPTVADRPIVARSQTGENVPAGTPFLPAPAASVPALAGLAQGICHLAGVGPISADTARRLSCDAPLLGAVVDRYGNPLAMGRTRRLVTRRQRRALMIRDRMCRFPGCDQTRRLKAHHIIHWACGGRTDLDNLILLCQWHHTTVHEGSITIHRRPSAEGLPVGFEFAMPNGKPYPTWLNADQLATHLIRQQGATEPAARPADDITGFGDPRAKTIRPRWAGERVDLHACVEALFAMKLPAPTDKEPVPLAA